MPDTTPIREHNFGEGPNRAKHSGYAQGGRETRTYHRESSIHRRKGPAPTPDYDDIDSPETSIGYKRFIDPEGSGPIHDVSHDYNPPREDLPYNSWGFPGTWTVGPEIAFLDKASGGLVYRVHARDLHLLRGPKDDGSAVHFRITIDGASPGDNHGTDVSADGYGVVLEQRLYQLVRQSRKIGPPHLRDRISRSWGSRPFVHLWLRCRARLAAGRRVHSIPNESAERARDIIAACGPPSRRWRG